MEKMSFKDNLLQKLELERLAAQVIASCGTEQSQHPVDKEAMRRLLELSPYQYQRQRDLDLYVKPAEGELKMILVLDNKLPIFRSTVQDVVVRRSPRTLEMWKISTIRKILVDSDIKLSTRAKSVETVLKDALAQLDLTYTDKDIEDLAREGMAWLAGNDAEKVEKILSLFAALLGYGKQPKDFGLDNTISYGVVASGRDNEVVFGPLVLYRPAANTLAWIDQSIPRSDQQKMGFLRSVATGQTTVPVTGDEVFQKLKANVLALPERVLSIWGK
jgi:hypothetical protein